MYTCSKIYDRMPDIPRAPVGSTQQKNAGMPNGIDRKSLGTRGSNISYHRAIGCKTPPSAPGVCSYPLALFFFSPDSEERVSEIPLLRGYLRCPVVTVIILRYIDCKIIFSTYYRVFNEIEASKKKRIRAFPTLLLTESHSRILFSDSDSR